MGAGVEVDLAELDGLVLGPVTGSSNFAGELVAGTLDAFLAQRLTGEATTEPGQAGRSLLYNLDRGDWDSELCDLFGVPQRALPRLLASAEPRGEWRESLDKARALLEALGAELGAAGADGGAATSGPPEPAAAPEP